MDDIVNSMPAIRYGFAYGSGAVKQEGYSSEDKPMIDFVFVVDDSRQWHIDNLKANRHHYSGLLAALGPNAITRVQEFGAGVFFNPLVTYGLTQIDHTGAHPNPSALKSLTFIYIWHRYHGPIGILSTE
jgi:translocator assembly and maintenance protein 41